MVDGHALGAVAGIYAVGVMSPGPNFMVVAQRAVARGRTEALVTGLGVVSVSALWAASSLFGLGVMFTLFPWIRLLLKVVGAGYLLWAGLRLWRQAGAPIATVPAAEAGTRPGPWLGLWPAFRAGLATNLANAKAIAFYGSAFAAAAPAPGKTETLWLALALVLAIALVWYGLVAVALSAGAVARGYLRAKGVVERACGALMMLFGVRLAASG